MRYYTESDIEAILNAKMIGQKFVSTPTAGVPPYLHGTSGLFSQPGQDARVFSAMHLPMMGLMDALPIMPAGTAAQGLDPQYVGADSPFYTTVTGVTQGALDTKSNQPTTACPTPPKPGLTKVCTLVSPYGRFFGGVRAMDLTQVARLTNRGEPTDLTIVNEAPNTGAFASSTLFGALKGGTTNELNMRLFEAAVSFKRMLAPLVFTSDPNNTVASEGYKEFTGFDLLINVGNKRDALTGNVCTAMNSFIYNFQGFRVDSNGTAYGDIVKYIDHMYYTIEWNATQSGLAPVELALVMRPELFDELTKVWPIRYYQEALVQIANFSGGRVNFDARDTTNMRDDLRNGSWLPIRGKRVRVIQDDTIAETQPSVGTFQSDIYFVPFTVLGGIPVTYWEPSNYNAQGVQRVLQFISGIGSMFNTSDNGHFLWWSSFTNTCVDFSWLMEMRLVLRTPHLAGRLQNVAYRPLDHTRGWLDSGVQSSFFTDGGRTVGITPSYYNEWSSSPLMIDA